MNFLKTSHKSIMYKVVLCICWSLSIILLLNIYQVFRFHKSLKHIGVNHPQTDFLKLFYMWLGDPWIFHDEITSTNCIFYLTVHHCKYRNQLLIDQQSKGFMVKLIFYLSESSFHLCHNVLTLTRNNHYASRWNKCYLVS